MNVKVLTLDGWLRKHRDVRPSLLKIDVEGAEGLVLAGARQTLRRDRPVVVCEIHGEAPGRAAWRELKRAGYRVETVEERRALTHPPAGGHIVAWPPTPIQGHLNSPRAQARMKEQIRRYRTGTFEP